MVQPRSTSDLEEVVDTMIALTRLSKLHRAIIAGNDSMELYLVLRRRGFIRIATPATCRVPKGLHAVGLRIRKRLQEMGFRIEAGVRCQRGLVLSAYRSGYVEMEKAA